MIVGIENFDLSFGLMRNASRRKRAGLVPAYMIGFAVLGLSSLASGIPSAAMAQNSELVVYSYRSESLVRPLFDDFERRTGIKVSGLFGSVGLIDRIAAEGDRSPGHILLTLQVSQAEKAKALGITREIPESGLTPVPKVMRDPNGHWVALTLRPRIFFVHPDRVAEGSITTYEQLASPRFKGRICTRSGQHAYQTGLAGAMYARFKAAEERRQTRTRNLVIEEDASFLEWIRGLKGNLARRPQGNDRDQMRAVAEGVCDIAVANHYYYGVMLDSPTDRAYARALKPVFPTFVDGGTYGDVSGVSILKSAKPALRDAILFVEYLVSEAGQRIYAQANHEIPAREGTPVPNDIRAIGKFSADPIAFQDNREAIEKASQYARSIGYDR